MNYAKFLDRIITRGIEAAKRDYSRPDQKQKLQGSLAGFETCRGKNPAELQILLTSTRIATRNALNRDDYWWYRCYEAEVEWVCNCVSVVLNAKGLSTIVAPTCRALQTVVEIVGIGLQLD